MKKKVQFGIGFVTGRTNVCRVINSYYQNILDQIKRYKEEVQVTFFILFDTSYQQEKREDSVGKSHSGGRNKKKLWELHS